MPIFFDPATNKNAQPASRAISLSHSIQPISIQFLKLHGQKEQLGIP